MVYFSKAYTELIICMIAYTEQKYEGNEQIQNPPKIDRTGQDDHSKIQMQSKNLMEKRRNYSN